MKIHRKNNTNSQNFFLKFAEKKIVKKRMNTYLSVRKNTNSQKNKYKFVEKIIEYFKLKRAIKIRRKKNY